MFGCHHPNPVTQRKEAISSQSRTKKSELPQGCLCLASPGVGVSAGVGRLRKRETGSHSKMFHQLATIWYNNMADLPGLFSQRPWKQLRLHLGRKKINPPPAPDSHKGKVHPCGLINQRLPSIPCFSIDRKNSRQKCELQV